MCLPCKENRYKYSKTIVRYLNRIYLIFTYTEYDIVVNHSNLWQVKCCNIQWLHYFLFYSVSCVWYLISFVYIQCIAYSNVLLAIQTFLSVRFAISRLKRDCCLHYVTFPENHRTRFPWDPFVSSSSIGLLNVIVLMSVFESYSEQNQTKQQNKKQQQKRKERNTNKLCKY